jgi:hypothetical protein
MKEYIRSVKRKIFKSKAQNTKNDISFISFPKSGRTWVRSFLNYYFFYCYPLSVIDRNSKKYHGVIPNINFGHGKHNDLKINNISKEARRYRSKKTILLMRDPRDVYVSYYFQRTKRHVYNWYKKINWENIKIGELLKDEVFGIKRIIEYMNTWYESLKESENCMILFYEEIKKEPMDSFKKLIGFIKANDTINEEALQKSIEENAFDKMKLRESKAVSSENELLPTKINDEESFKVRKGKVGNYVEYFTELELKFLNNEFDHLHLDLKKRFT